MVKLALLLIQLMLICSIPPASTRPCRGYCPSMWLLWWAPTSSPQPTSSGLWLRPTETLQPGCLTGRLVAQHEVPSMSPYLCQPLNEISPSIFALLLRFCRGSSSS